MSLWHCSANGVFGQFGDYVLARTKEEARLEFYKMAGCWPTRVVLERRAK